MELSTAVSESRALHWVHLGVGAVSSPCPQLRLLLSWPPADPRIHLLSLVCWLPVEPRIQQLLFTFLLTLARVIVCACVCVCAHSPKHCRCCKGMLQPCQCLGEQEREGQESGNTARSTHRHMHMRSGGGGACPEARSGLQRHAAALPVSLEPQHNTHCHIHTVTSTQT